MKKRFISAVILMLVMAAVLIMGGCTGNSPANGDKSSDNGTGASNGSQQDADKEGGSTNGSTQNGGSTNNSGSENGDGTGSNGSGNDGGTSGKCEITAFSIGKADSLLIISGDASILIDTGEEESAEYICNGIREKGVEKLDLLVITHFDRDHAGGIGQIMQEFDTDKVIYPDYANTKDGYMTFRRAVSGRLNDDKVTAVSEYNIGSLNLTVYPEENPDALRAKSNDFDNDMSLVCMLRYKDYRFLFAGDIEKERTDELLDSGIDLKCDWIKMPHHGRYNKKIKGLLDICAASYAVVTDSDDAIAETDTLVELQKRKVKTLSTRNGDVVTVADENGISVKNVE